MIVRLIHHWGISSETYRCSSTYVEVWDHPADPRNITKVFNWFGWVRWVIQGRFYRSTVDFGYDKERALTIALGTKVLPVFPVPGEGVSHGPSR